MQSYFRLGSRTWVWRPVLFAVALVLSVLPMVAQGNGNGGANNANNNKGGTAAGDAAWLAIQNALNRVATQPAGKSAAWSALATLASKFQTDFPNHANARAAAKLVATALVAADDDLPQVSAKAVTTANRFVDDYKNGIHDRVSVLIALEQAQMRRVKYATRTDWLTVHSNHARELIRRFPDQPEGYGYLLSLAQSESFSNSHHLADELSQLPAPAKFLAGARRVVDRLNLVGKPLALPGAEAEISAARGSILVIYVWTKDDVGLINRVTKLADLPMTHFIGVNLDADTQSARAVATAQKLPGAQFYDGAGTNGPMAKALDLFCSTALYYVDRSGIVRDVNADSNAQYKLSQLVLGREIEP